MEGFYSSAQWKVGIGRRAAEVAGRRVQESGSGGSLDLTADATSPTMAEPSNNDLKLLRRMAGGNEAAFESLYQRYQGPLYRFVLHMSGNAAMAEEITQEVFMAVINKPKSYDPVKGTVAGYLFGIARNLIRRSLDETCQDVPLLEEAAEHDVGDAYDADLAEELSQAEGLECLRKAVASLPQCYREVVVLCELEEMAYPDAAAILKCSPGTVASRLHRAKAILKKKLRVQGCMR